MSTYHQLIETSASMSSREISELTDKRHPDVKRDIRNMLDSLEKDVSSFARIYLDAHGRDQEEYGLPKNLTLNLIAGYRPDIRLKVIDRWMELEGDISKLSPAEQLLRQAQQLVDQERQINELQHQQSELQYQQTETQAQVKALVDGEDYFTVIGYANVVGRKFDSKAAARIGKTATALCHERGWETGKSPHPHYGTVNSYPREVLEIAFKDFSQQEVEHEY